MQTKQTLSKRKSNGSRRVQLHMDTESRVEQHHVGETNINAIMAKYHKTGQLPDPVLHAVYGDFSNAEDFHTAHDKILGALEMFQQLPADIRTFFENDPAQLLGFVGDPDNLEEARKMGLVPLAPPEAPEVPEKPAEVAVTPPPAEAPSESASPTPPG